MENTAYLDKMDKIKLMIQYHLKDGKKIKYSISVDELEVISLSDNVLKFDRYKEFVTGESKQIRVRTTEGEHYKIRQQYSCNLKDSFK